MFAGADAAHRFKPLGLGLRAYRVYVEFSYRTWGHNFGGFWVHGVGGSG